MKCSFGTKPATTAEVATVPNETNTNEKSTETSAEPSTEQATNTTNEPLTTTDEITKTIEQTEKSEATTPTTKSSINKDGDNASLSYFEVFGEGKSKKAANKEAAKAMIAIVEAKFEPLLTVAAASQQVKKKRSANSTQRERQTSNSVGSSDQNQSIPGGGQLMLSRRRVRANNIVKVKKTSPEYGKGSINPISRLIQIQQAKNEVEPVFELLSSTNRLAASTGSGPQNGQVRNHPHGRRTEFLIQVILTENRRTNKIYFKNVHFFTCPIQLRIDSLLCGIRRL